MMKKRRKIRKMRVATGVFDEDFSTGSHGQVGPPMAFSRCTRRRIQERDAPIPPMPQHVLRREEETDRVLRSS